MGKVMIQRTEQMDKRAFLLPGQAGNILRRPGKVPDRFQGDPEGLLHIIEILGDRVPFTAPGLKPQGIIDQAFILVMCLERDHLAVLLLIIKEAVRP